MVFLEHNKYQKRQNSNACRYNIRYYLDLYTRTVVQEGMLSFFVFSSFQLLFILPGGASFYRKINFQNLLKLFFQQKSPSRPFSSLLSDTCGTITMSLGYPQHTQTHTGGDLAWGKAKGCLPPEKMFTLVNVPYTERIMLLLLYLYIICLWGWCSGSVVCTAVSHTV